MKKIAALAMAMLMVTCLFAGCAKKEAANDDLSYVKDKGTLVIGITEYAPMNYYDDSGKLIEVNGYEWGSNSMVRQQRCRHFSAICKVNITPSCWTFKPLMLLNLRMAIYFLLLSQALFCMR